MRLCALAILLAACGGISAEQAGRAQREYELGVGLYDEHNLPGAFQHLLRATELDPDNASAHFMLGHLFQFRGEYPRSEHHYLEALRANHAVPVRPSLDAEVNNSLGVLYINMHRNDDAVRVLTLSTEDLLNHEPAVAWANLGRAHLERGELDEALRCVQQSIQITRDLCISWYWLGRVHFAREEWEQAEQALVHALEFPNEQCQRLQAAWRLRAEVRARLGHREEAISDLERCVELEATNEDGQACARLLEGANEATP